MAERDLAASHIIAIGTEMAAVFSASGHRAQSPVGDLRSPIWPCNLDASRERSDVAEVGGTSGLYVAPGLATVS